jgi:uncharacterized protein (DUF1778 family)
MRIEATIPDLKAQQVDSLAEELGVSKSQLIDEALSLFVKAAMETKLGHRVAIVSGDTREAICELASPSLTQLEWVMDRERVHVSAKAMGRVAKLLAKPPAPTPALRRALSRKSG